MRKRTKSLLISVAVVIVLTAIVLCACQGQNKYTVKFIIDGQVYHSVSVSRGGKVPVPEEPKKSGYRFDGWYLDDGVWTQPFNSTTSVIADISVYAHWLEIVSPEPETYVITFDSNGGSAVSAIRVREGYSFTLPASPERADYAFGGWYLDSACTAEFTTSYTVTKDMTVYAKWTLKNSETYFVVEKGTLVSLTEDGKSTKELALPESVNGVTITAIGDGLFENCTNLQSVSFPKNSSYVRIGERAFAGCTSLKSFKFSNSVTEIDKEAFSGCTSLTSAQLSSETKTIGEGAFKNCEKLSSVVALRVESIGKEAFSGCRSLVSFSVPATVEEIGEKAFYNCYGMSSLAFRTEEVDGVLVGVKKIGDQAFCNCKKLTSVIIPNTVTEIGENAFGGCSAVTSLTLGTGITQIPVGAFASMGALTDVTFLGEVTSIGKQAFSNAKALKTLVLPDTVTELGIGFMYNATSLEAFTAPAGVTSIPESAFENCTALASVSIPDGVTVIGTRAFRSCVKLESITLPTGITEIGQSAFRDCTALTTITLPDSLSGIADGTFMGCKALSAVTYGSGITTIGASAFKECVALTEVVLSDSVRSVSESAYDSCTAITSVIFGSNTETIGSKAFASCTALSSVTYSKNTKEMSATAFYGCTALLSVTVPDENTYFKSVDGVLLAGGGEELALYPVALTSTSYTVPDGVKKLNDGVFENNTYLVSVTLPEGLKEIGATAFKGCVSLKTVNYPSTLEVIGDSAFENCSSLQNAKLNQGLHTLGARAFYHNYALTSAELPATLVSVGRNVFEGINQSFIIKLDSPADKDLPEGWNELWSVSGGTYKYTINRGTVLTYNYYKYVVRDNKAVLTGYLGDEEEITVPSEVNGYEVIGLYGTFDGNTKVTKLTIPNSVKVITDTTLRGCNALTTLITPFVGAYRGAKGVGGLIGFMFEYSETTKIGWTKQPASGGNYNYYYANIPSTLTTVELTDCVTIAHGAFGECNSIRNITLPDGLETIGAWAFNNVSVRTLTLPSSVKEVGENAFTRSYLDYYKPESDTVDPTLELSVSFTVKNIPEGFTPNECFTLTEDKNYYGKEGVRVKFKD